MKDYLSEEVRYRLNEFKIKIYKDKKITDERIISDLLDLIEFNTIDAYRNWLKTLKIRIKNGINRQELFQIKMIYTFLGHFLQKIREI